jgi:hypothetical protein
MHLTKGHNNLTKLNEITSYICGRFSHDHLMASDKNLNH